MKSIKANGAEFAYGDAGEGPPLLLLHGFSLDHSVWDLQREALAPTCRVIAPDLRASGKTKNPGAPITMELLADDMAAFLDALEIPAAAVGGFSLGGYILCQMLLRHPEKVRAGGFISSRPTPPVGEEDRRRREQIAFLRTKGAAAFADLFLEKLFSPAYAAAHPEEVAHTHRVISSQRLEDLAALTEAIRTRKNVASRLGEVRVPCAVVFGDRDDLIPAADMRAMHDCLFDATLTVAEEAGHMTPLEAPAEVSEALEGLLARGGLRPRRA